MWDVGWMSSRLTSSNKPSEPMMLQHCKDRESNDVRTRGTIPYRREGALKSQRGSDSGIEFILIHVGLRGKEFWSQDTHQSTIRFHAGNTW
jgi:hypothetical protein